jgi:hypothetical protein
MKYATMLCAGILTATAAIYTALGQSESTSSRDLQPLQLEEQIPIPQVAGDWTTSAPI